MKKYIVYLTTNKVNNKIYIGVHGTENPDIFDTYLGDGVYSNSPKSYNHQETPFQSAVAKYGPKNFYRTTLKVFDNLQDALNLETWLVCPSFIARTDTYNITLGGGMPPDPSKVIYQYDLEGNFIKEWESIKSIFTYYNVNKDRIRMVINDHRSFMASYWSEEKFNKLDITTYRPSVRGCLRQYTTDGRFLTQFKNATEAAKALDIDRERLVSAITDKYSILGFWFLKEGEKIEDYLSGEIKHKPKIFQYDSNGDFIKEWKTFKDIKKEYKINKPDTLRAMKLQSFLSGYYWSDSKYKNIIKESKVYKDEPKQVYQYDCDYNLIKVWDSINSCKKEYPSVLQVCLGKRNHCKGFKFSFEKLKILSELAVMSE